MQSYTIQARNQTHRLVESAGTVTRSTIDFLEGLSFVTARQLLEQKGWKIIPDVEEPKNVFEFRGDTFELQWSNGLLATITKNGEEISWKEMPEQLKELL